MIIAVLDDQQSLKLWQATPQGLQQVAEIQAPTNDPVVLAEMSATLAAMAGVLNGSTPRKAPLALPPGKSRKRKDPSKPLGSVKLQLLKTLDDGQWHTSRQIAEAAGVDIGGVSASLSQWAKRGQVESRDAKALKTAGGKPAKEHRITAAGRESLRQLKELLEPAT